MSLESLPPELKLLILYLPWDPLELESLFLASRSFWTIYKLNKDPIATSITLDEVSKRGISLRDLKVLSPAYIEYWISSPDVLNVDVALRRILGHDTRRALTLLPEERVALKGLEAIRGWFVHRTKTGARELKTCIFDFDYHRIMKHALGSSEYRLLSAEGMEAAFKELKDKWDQGKSERILKAELKGQSITIDRFGQEHLVGRGGNWIITAGKKLYYRPEAREADGV